MEKCAKCGEILDEGVRFCTSCGAPVEADETLPDHTDAAEESAAPPDAPAGGAPEVAHDGAKENRGEPAPPKPQQKKKKRKKRRVKKRFFAFLAILLLLPAGITALFVLKPWKSSAGAKTDPFLGQWTATRVDYMGSEYTASQLFPNGIPVLTITRRRVTLSFSGSSGKGRRTTAGDTVTFPCLGKTYSAQLAGSALKMDMNGMTISFSQTQGEATQMQNADEHESSDPIAGVWTAEAYTAKDHGPGYASDLFKSGCTITLQADGTGTVKADTYAEKITWTAAENTITLTGTILFPSLEYRDGLLYGAYSRSGTTLRFTKG